MSSSSGSDSHSDSNTEDSSDDEYASETLGQTVGRAAPPSSHREAMKGVTAELQSAVGANRRADKVVRFGPQKVAHWNRIRQTDFQTWAEAVADGESAGSPPRTVPAHLGTRSVPPPLLQVNTLHELPSVTANPVSPLRRIYTPNGSPETFLQTHTRVRKNDMRHIDAYADERKQMLDLAAKKRANEQCMPLLQQNLVQRMQLRTVALQQGSGPGSAEDYGAQRQAVTGHANRFDTIYAQTQETIRPMLSFSPPRRHNSLAFGEVSSLVLRLQANTI